MNMSILMPLSYMGMLFLIASIPDTGGATSIAEHLLALVPPTVQNLLHIPAYGLLAPLWIFVLRARGMSERWSLYVTLPSAFAYGGITELYQASVPGRYPSVSDFLYDTVGILLFVWLYQLVERRFDLGRVTRPFHP